MILRSVPGLLAHVVYPLFWLPWLCSTWGHFVFDFVLTFLFILIIGNMLLKFDSLS